MIKTCKNGHQFTKTSDCPICPICEKLKKPVDGFLSLLSAPARRALENFGIKSIQDLSNYSEKELLKLHGFGKSSLPIINKALIAEGLKFREEWDYKSMKMYLKSIKITAYNYKYNNIIN